jgi:hypothetical protein
MKSSKLTALTLGLILILFSSCKKTGFSEMDSNRDGFGIVITPPAPTPISNCANKDMDSQINSEDTVKVKEIIEINLHLYSCDAENFKEIIWLSSGLIKYTADPLTIQSSFDTLGSHEVQAIIIYKDTVLDSRGNYVEGTKPKVIKKNIISI